MVHPGRLLRPHATGNRLPIEGFGESCIAVTSGLFGGRLESTASRDVSDETVGIAKPLDVNCPQELVDRRTSGEDCLRRMLSVGSRRT